jgi:hypothetical protein
MEAHTKLRKAALRKQSVRSNLSLLLLPEIGDALD